MTSKHRSALDALAKHIAMARHARDPFELLSELHRISGEARELERAIERDITERGRAAGLTIDVSLRPPLRAAG